MTARELFSAQVFRDPVLLAGLVLVVAGAPVVWGGTLRYLRRHRDDLEGFRAALACSGLAALPGLALALDLVMRSAWTCALGVACAPTPEWPTVGLASAWLFLVPALFFWSLGERWLQTTPKRLNLVQAGHWLLCLASSAVAFRLASGA